MFELKGKVAVVTGASSGLGKSMAKGLAQQGADVAILARRIERLQELKSELEQTYGVKCLPVQCDVTKEDNVIDAAKQVEEFFGRADILINCAGKGLTIPIENLSFEDWKSDFDVDVHGIFLMTREIGKLMIKHNYGRIINIASMYGLVGNTALPSSAYHAAKGAVVNLTRAVAAEWAGKGIVCNCICPGYFSTELTEETLNSPEFTEYMKIHVPLGRYGNLEEINGLAVFLASEEASYITGAIIPIDGGYTAV